MLDLLHLLREVAARSGGLKIYDAQRLCRSIPRYEYVKPHGGFEEANLDFPKELRSLFPAFNWRGILDRSGERSSWTLTVEDDDPREHYFHSLGGTCIHCGKTAREISRINEVNGDDEFLKELEMATKVRYSGQGQSGYGPYEG